MSCPTVRVQPTGSRAAWDRVRSNEVFGESRAGNKSRSSNQNVIEGRDERRELIKEADQE
jgi:hypothetical protein